MAKFTLTGTTVRNLTVFRDFGLNAAYSKFVMVAQEGYPSSMSQTVYAHMIPLPNGARIMDGYITVSDAADGAVQVGMASSLSSFVQLTSVAAAALIRFNVPTGVGSKVSLTASDVNGYTTIVTTAVLMNTASPTMTIQMCVYYAVEDQV